MKWKMYLCGALAAAMLIPTAAGADFTDTESHWAAGSIDRWSGHSVVNGYSDGRFGPDDPITRGQMAAMLDRIFGWKETAESPFRDIRGDEWYAPAVLRAAAAGVMNGDGGGNARPDAPITRQETAVMLSRALALRSGGQKKTFHDEGQIAPWAKEAADIMASLGIIGGTPEGAFAPDRAITRAETTAILDRAISGYYDRAGVYSENVDGVLAIVAAPGVTLRGVEIAGDLIIAPGAEGSEVILTDVTVAGRVRILSGKEAQVLVTGASVLDQVEVAGENARLILLDEAKITVLTVSGSGAHIRGLPDGMKVAVGAGVEGVKVNGRDTAPGTEVTAGPDISSELDDIEIEIDPENGGSSGGSGTGGGGEGQPADPEKPTDPEQPGGGENRDEEGNIIVDFDDLFQDQQGR